MPPDPEESFEVDLEPSGKYLRHEQRLEQSKTRTANVLAIILVAGIIASLPLYLLAVWLAPSMAERFTVGYEKWITIVGTLAATAVGTYYGVRMQRQNREG